MTKVKLHFTLVGKTDQWKKYIKDKREDFTNEDNLDYVKELVEDQFGNRPMFVVNQKMITDEAVSYPKFFAAKWFVSETNPRTELVVISHGDTMDAANKAAMETLKTLEWDKLAVRI